MLIGLGLDGITDLLEYTEGQTHSSACDGVSSHNIPWYDARYQMTGSTPHPLAGSRPVIFHYFDTPPSATGTHDQAQSQSTDQMNGTFHFSIRPGDDASSNEVASRFAEALRSTNYYSSSAYQSAVGGDSATHARLAAAQKTLGDLLGHSNKFDLVRVPEDRGQVIRRTLTARSEGSHQPHAVVVVGYNETDSPIHSRAIRKTRIYTPLARRSQSYSHDWQAYSSEEIDRHRRGGESLASTFDEKVTDTKYSKDWPRCATKLTQLYDRYDFPDGDYKDFTIVGVPVGSIDWIESQPFNFLQKVDSVPDFC
ncbi:uncharacterized protein I303_101566 [Kwoniella dejecticola CBS 10117]|uniref:Uncharacterized protein n=1 Tax=Kwoniella dejecticola CBS 10117 TaxID=1296121 RepID=A0A1A6ADH2_9TREE|nr:uncharacterized protein I303_02302 [Kwoniella dejecticola CBS 10117]OBR88083.1 hypothetical protein I303_02302 [Kwoniella dejecticola CBS 10117]